MSSAELERIAAAVEHLAINHQRGTYHKPIALVWAIDRASRGLPRLATAATVRVQLDPLLETLAGAASNAAWPWLELANDLGEAWRVEGADPGKDPPADFVAGWSRSAYVEIAADSDSAQQLIDAVLDRYLSDVRETVVETLRLARGGPDGINTVIVAAADAYDEYLRYSAYICQEDRSFRPVERFGFYRNKRIEPLLPRVLFRRDSVTIDETTAQRLSSSENPDERMVGDLVDHLLTDGSPRAGNVQQVFLLSRPADDDTINLDAPIPHSGPSAWTQGQRYASSEALRSARSTDDL